MNHQAWALCYEVGSQEGDGLVGSACSRLGGLLRLFRVTCGEG